MAYRFQKDDKVRVKGMRYEGVEGVVTGSIGLPALVDIKITKGGEHYRTGEEDSFGEEYLELIASAGREVGQPIKPELVKIGDRIRAVRVPDDSGIETTRSGVVHEKENYYGAISFWTRGKTGRNRIGYPDDVTSHYILEEESAVHQLTLKPVGTKFKTVRGPGSSCYLIYTKYREGWWVCESYDNRSGNFVQITMRSEQTTINEWDKGRSKYL